MSELPWKNLKEMFDAIAEEAGVELSEVQLTARYTWFPRRDAMEVGLLAPVVGGEDKQKDLLKSLDPMVFNVDQPSPIEKQLKVIAIFDVGEDINVYALQVGAPQGGEKILAPTLYTLSKRSRTFGISRMPHTRFVEMIAHDLAEAADMVTPSLQERGDILEYLDSLPDDYSVRQAADDILDEMHYEGDEEEGEEEDKASTETAPAETNGVVEAQTGAVE